MGFFKEYWFGGSWGRGGHRKTGFMNQKIRLSPWIKDTDSDYSCMRIVEGTDPTKIENRIAFIEKSPRVRIAPYTSFDTDGSNWDYGPKGRGGNSEHRSCEAQEIYGYYKPSRKWCDERLIELGYILT